VLGTIAVVGSGIGALDLAEELGGSGDVGRVVVYGRQKTGPAHTVFARDLAEYVFGIQPLASDTSAVLIAVPDEAVPEVGLAIAALGPAPAGCAAFHLSGVLPTEALGALHGPGYALGAFHPLGASSRPSEGSIRVGGGYVAVTGSPAAVSMARRLTDALDAEVLEVPAARRPLVHAAAVLAGAYMRPLLSLSSRLMERAGVASGEAMPALLSLARSALDRVEEGRTSSTPANPIEDGDVETLALHLRALDPDDQKLYALFAREIARLEEHRLEPETLEAIHDVLAKYTALEPSSII